jgi:protein ImuB
LGELLSNARSKVLDLQVCAADPTADADALRKLALWAMRYAPVVAAWDTASGADGLFLDITGAGHLFGGEEHLLADLQHRLRSFGLYPRLAIAGTAGAAWALARHGKRNVMIIPPGEERKAIENLPLAALRLTEEPLTALSRLGFRRVGELIDQPRAPFASRFDVKLLSRLDQALGRAPEPLIPVVPSPVYRAQTHFLEPILEQEQVLAVATRLLETLMQDLARDATGARRLRLLLFKQNGDTVVLDLGLAAASRDAQHIAQLIGLRLYRLAAAFDTDFGFEAAAVHVLAAETMTDRQPPLAIAAHNAGSEELTQLIDRLQQRLGAGAVGQLIARQSHIPERAVQKIKGFALNTSTAVFLNPSKSAPPSMGLAATSPFTVSPPSGAGVSAVRRNESVASTRLKKGVASTRLKKGVASTRQMGVSSTRQMGVSSTRPDRDPQRQTKPYDKETTLPPWAPDLQAGARPLMLLAQPEVASVMALIPEGPPRQFRWRGVLHQVADATGPERITPEWWRRTGAAVRDYYVVEDTAGRRFWLFRSGSYDRDADRPQWFVHGVFA